MPRILTIQGVCRRCEGNWAVSGIGVHDFTDWKKGEKLIQEAMYYLNEEQRECLITNLCPSCQNEVYAEIEKWEVEGNE